MAIYKKKVKTIEAVQFKAADPPEKWPPKVQVNIKSSTGYSYDDLSEYIEPDDPDLIASKKGFEISDGDFIIIDGKRIYKMSEVKFKAKYEVV